MPYSAGLKVVPFVELRQLLPGIVTHTQTCRGGKVLPSEARGHPLPYVQGDNFESTARQRGATATTVTQ